MNRATILGALAVVVGGCSGSTVSAGSFLPDAGSTPADAGAADTGGAVPADGGEAGGPTTSATVAIRLRGSTAPIAISDGHSGETPLVQRLAIRSLKLLRDANDPSPLVVLDLAGNPVEAGVGDKDDTLLGTVAASNLVKGSYTVARVGVAYVRYSVAATMHASGASLAGEFDNVQVLSAGVTVDGTPRAKGWYSFSFASGGTTYGTLTGPTGPLPPSSGGAFALDTSGDVAEYVFPVNVPVDPSITRDLTVAFEVNTYEAFRWQDEATAGYSPGVFDSTPSASEPVKSFGANAFTVSLE